MAVCKIIRDPLLCDATNTVMVLDCKTLILKQCFPRRDIGPRVVPERTPEGRTKWSTRSEAESCAAGLSWPNVSTGGN
jgi:hypothetical protein